MFQKIKTLDNIMIMEGGQFLIYKKKKGKNVFVSCLGKKVNFPYPSNNKMIQGKA